MIALNQSVFCFLIQRSDLVGCDEYAELIRRGDPSMALSDVRLYQRQCASCLSISLLLDRFSVTVADLYQHVNVKHLDTGQPFLLFSNEFSRLLRAHRILDIKLSLSYLEDSILVSLLPIMEEGE